MMSKKQHRRPTIWEILWWSFVGCVLLLLLGIIVLQAFLRISSGDYAGGENYMGQSIGPLLQLTVVLIALIILAIGACYHFRGTPKSPKKKKRGKKADDDHRPEWLNQPPYKFPWE